MPDQTAVIPESDLQLIRAFHGHIGPYVIAGMRLGRHALARLGADPHFGIEVEVRCPDHPPVSCSLDGIQFATGCTLGKMNIRHRCAEGVTAHFRVRESGRTLTLRLRPEAMERAVAEMRVHDDVAGAAVVQGMDDAELLEEIPEP